MATQSIAIAPQTLGIGYYARAFRKETQYEFVRMLRTKAFSLSVIGFPVMFYLLFGTSNRHNMYARYLMPSYSCMGVVSACLFGIGMGIALERAQGWLELKQASPMPRFVYLGAKVISCAAFAIVIVATLVVLGITLGGVTLTALEASWPGSFWPDPSRLPQWDCWSLSWCRRMPGPASSTSSTCPCRLRQGSGCRSACCPTGCR
jgi:ABC-2 type transport system permease protein